MAWTAVLPRKWIETSRPPRADWPAERAAGVAAKVPTAKPPTAPTAAPMRNFVVPSPNRKLLPAPELRRRQFSTATWGGSLAEPCELYWETYVGDGEEEASAGPPGRGCGAARPGRRTPRRTPRPREGDLRRPGDIGPSAAGDPGRRGAGDLGESRGCCGLADPLREGPAARGQRHGGRPPHQP